MGNMQRGPPMTTLGDLVVQRLSDAVKIPTIVTDGMGMVGEDSAWEIFYTWTAFLEKTFPLVHKHLEREIINEHGHIFTWRGSDSKLKPLLMMAHSDVVPVEDTSEITWTYDPFSGHCDEEYVWGRGSEDNKSNLIVQMSLVEKLIEQGWSPARTILMCFGFDEEGGADQSYGARCIANRVEEIYGQNGVEMIIDENFASLEVRDGREVAIPALSEKGYLDVEICLTCPGGHSSYPPTHSGIGFLAQAIKLIEENPLPRPGQDKEETRKVGGEADKDEVLTRTTSAVTVMRAGEKINSMPEVSRVFINHRIASHDSVRAVKDHYVKLLKPWAWKHNLDLDAFDGLALISDNQCQGTVKLISSWDLDPSPVSPTSDPCFDLLCNATRKVFGEHIEVKPDILAGNTDTRYYWRLTPNIYRMTPFRASHDPRGTRMHTVDERMPIRGLLEMVDFYTHLVESMDKFRRK